MPRPLSEIAIAASLVTSDQVVDAARWADLDKVPLVVALVRRHEIDEVALVAAIRREMRISLVDPVTVTPESDALRTLSRDTARRLRVLPLSLSILATGPKVLSVAMADPTDHVAAAEVEHLTGCRVDVSLMPLSAIEELVETSYRSFVTEVMQRGSRGDRVFGGDLHIITKPMEGQAAGSDRERPATTPYHRVSEEADLAVRLAALVAILVNKNLMTEDEYEAEIVEILKRRDGDE